MTLTMDISKIRTLGDIEKFLAASQEWNFTAGNKKEIYAWIQEFLVRIRYRKLRKKEKQLVKKFLRRVTGYSEIQLKRLLSKHRAGKLEWKVWQKGTFTSIYEEHDIALLHDIERAHRLSGPATKKKELSAAGENIRINQKYRECHWKTDETKTFWNTRVSSGRYGSSRRSEQRKGRLFHQYGG